jgi:hypothetical protein
MSLRGVWSAIEEGAMDRYDEVANAILDQTCGDNGKMHDGKIAQTKIAAILRESFPGETFCPYCGGEGQYWDGDPNDPIARQCEGCNGTGSITVLEDRANKLRDALVIISIGCIFTYDQLGKGPVYRNGYEYCEHWVKDIARDALAAKDGK